MNEIISANLIAREIIKSELEYELPWINNLLRDAMNKGQLEIITQSKLSKPTKEVLIKLGYEIEELDECETKITCKTWYDISQNTKIFWDKFFMFEKYIGQLKS